VICAWEGAALRVIAAQDREHLQVFLRVTFSKILA